MVVVVVVVFVVATEVVLLVLLSESFSTLLKFSSVAFPSVPICLACRLLERACMVDVRFGLRKTITSHRRVSAEVRSSSMERNSECMDAMCLGLGGVR